MSESARHLKWLNKRRTNIDHSLKHLTPPKLFLEYRRHLISERKAIDWVLQNHATATISPSNENEMTKNPP